MHVQTISLSLVYKLLHYLENYLTILFKVENAYAISNYFKKAKSFKTSLDNCCVSKYASLMYFNSLASIFYSCIS